MSKKRTGGRVTPKGTQPAGTHRHQQADRKQPERGQGPVRDDQQPGRNAFGPVAPVRSGHHRGNR
jgi:hypothetical protein